MINNNVLCNASSSNKLYKKRLKKIKMMKIRFRIISSLGFHKVKWLKKKKIFKYLGDNVLYQPNILPNNPQLIKIHNNVKIAANVIFYDHDVINTVFSSLDKKQYNSHVGCIEIFDNCFIGGSCIILNNVKIGPNAIVAAGSVVTKDVPEGCVVGGNPAKIIGKFDDLYNKRKLEDLFDNITFTELYEKKWDEFNKRK